MTSAELIAYFRGLSADNAAPYLYSDETLLRLATEAEREAARRSRLIVDSTTEAICKITVNQNEQAKDLDPRILFVRRVTIDSKQDPLFKIHYRDLDLVAPGWLNEAASSVTHYCTNYQPGKIYFHTKFPAGDVVRLTVVRDPLAALTLTGVNPEIPARYQEKLVHWMFYRALNLRDVEEKYDPQVAKEELIRFEAEFGPASRAIDETWFQREHGYDEFEGLY